tara:strand:+ start:1242 stop:1736 length:495 start_codon:yes stop_codon:yes gene_type:complete
MSLLKKYDRDDLCDFIIDNHYALGWTDFPVDVIAKMQNDAIFGCSGSQYLRGLLLSFDDGFDIIICAGIDDLCISVYYQQKGSLHWNFLSKHNSLWISDGIYKLFNLDEKKTLEEMREVFVEEEKEDNIPTIRILNLDETAIIENLREGFVKDKKEHDQIEMDI